MTASYKYTAIARTIDGWIRTGMISWPNLPQYSHSNWNAFDVALLNFLGVPRLEKDVFFEECYDRAGLFNEAQRSGELNFDWIFGEHGLTLFKMKMAQATKESDHAV